MKVTYRGNFGVSFSTESHISATLEAMGHDVIRSQENKVDWSEQVLACKGADLFLWTSTYGYAQKHKHGELDAITYINGMLPTAAIHLDLFFGLARARQVEECGWFKLHHVFTADGDHEQEFRDAGVNHHFLMPGVFKPECELGTYRDEYASDIAFVGAQGGYHTEYKGRAQIVRWLKETYGDRCAFWPEPGKHAIRGQDLNDLYASVKVVVGDSCFADTAVNYTSDRVFETVGRGGFLLYPRIACVAKELQEDVHLAYFEPGLWSDLQGAIECWLTPERAEYRNAIRKAGSAYVRENCSYRNRLAQMLDVMGLQ